MVALATGLASANFALERGFGFQKKASGPWAGWIHATAPVADPYTKAHFSRNGVLPPPPLESLLFQATTDDTGEPLSADCTYRVSGAFPPARRWTLTLYSAGGLVANPANRYAFSNETVVYEPDGAATVMLGADPLPGNWLPMARIGNHALALALYDTPLATEAFLSDTTLPAIIRIGCRR